MNPPAEVAVTGTLVHLSDISAIAIAISAFVALIAFIINRNTMIDLKEVDVLMSCNARYDALYIIRSDVRGKPYNRDESNLDDQQFIENETVKDYYRRYWSLQADQMDYLLKGVLSVEDMAYWFYTKRREFSKPRNGIALDYMEGWKLVGRPHNKENKLFRNYIDWIVDSLGTEKDERTVRNWLKPFKKRRWWPMMPGWKQRLAQKTKSTRQSTA